MSSLFGKTIAFLVLLVATVALGYTAWEIRDLKASLARTAQGNQSNLTELMVSLAHAEGQLARVREAVELLGAGLSNNSDGTALEGKLAAALSSAQREVLQQELKKWAQQLQDQRDKSLAAVRESLEQEVGRSVGQGNRQLSALVEKHQGSLTKQLKDLGTNLAKPSGSTARQGQTLANLEKRLAAVADTVNEQGQALAQRNERDEKRWDDFSLKLEESIKVTERRYAQVAALLEAQSDGTPKPVATAGPGQVRPGPESPAADPGQQEWLAEFCAEVPQSALCKDL